jgi:hypothetical protein
MTMVDSVTAIVRYPADVWFAGSRTFTAAITAGARRVVQVTLDPDCRFPDREPNDNVWPRTTSAATPAGAVPQRTTAAACGR